MLSKLRFGLLITFAMAFLSNNLFADDREQDSLALVALYNATNGPNWYDNTNWLSNHPIDKWFGVYLDENGRVIELYLSTNNLEGNIPKEIGNLTELQHLDLSASGLSGNIPKEIGNLVNLEYLDLSYIKLKGEIPKEIGNLVNLEYLDLSSNGLSGNIPKEIGNLENLKILGLSLNKLEGNIPKEIGNLTNLRSLYLSFNGLSGNIPKEIGNLENLKNLRLSLNKLDFADFANIGINFFNNILELVYHPQSHIGQYTIVTKNEGESITIEAGDKFTTGNIYKWYKDENLLASETNQNIEIQSLSKNDEGVYTCEVTNNDFPDLTLYRRPFKIIINSTSVDNAFADLNSIIIYPNPAGDFINIAIDSDEGLLTREVQILDLLGLVVSKSELTDGNNRIDISNLARGTYFIKVGDKVEKFVKM